MTSFDGRVKQAAQLIQPDVRDMGDIQLLKLAIKELSEMPEDERARALAEHDIGPWNTYAIVESVKAGELIMPPYGWQPTHDMSVTKGILVKLRRGDKP